MGDVPSACSTKEKVFGDFFHELEDAADKESVVRKYVAAHPQWAADFPEEAALEHALAHAQPASLDAAVELPDFHLIREIARGGMGVVYEAEQLSLKRRVAVKVRRGRLAPGAHDRFQIEQEVLAQLHQTHIVPIHTAGQAGQWQYFAMAYIEGAALHRVVRATRQHTTSRLGAKTPTLAELAGEVLNQGKCQKKTADGSQADPSEGYAEQAKESSPADGTATLPSPAGVTLSLDYFRSVARVMADAAEALHHAHAANILHRDVKPSNLMVDTAGQCWLIDFGLARLVNGRGRARSQSGNAGEGGPSSFTAGPLGTPQYMAPEQYEERTDVRSDVWGLGVTLYELLALCPAFDAPTIEAIRERILQEEPCPPQNLVRNVPADLVAICRKAIQKKPEQRYQTAEEFAVDLGRWLGMEPTVARPARTFRRVFLWSRRHKGWAAAIVSAIVAFVAAAAGIIAMARANETIANERAASAEAKVAAARERELVLQLQRVRLSSHKDGWSGEAWGLLREISQTGSDDSIKAQAAANLLGLDAQIAKLFKEEASSVAFDATGRRLLLGGTSAKKGALGAPTRLVDSGAFETLQTSKGVDGPVAFDSQGTPLQFSGTDEGSFILWNVAKQQPVRELKVPFNKKAGQSHSVRIRSLGLELASDGSVAAAAATLVDDTDCIFVWDCKTGKLLQQLQEKTIALAFSPDGNLLATGNDEGRLKVWAVRERKLLGEFSTAGRRIYSLGFSNESRLLTQPGAPARLFGRIAAGDGGGSVTILSLSEGTPITICNGGSSHIYAVAFSPDGSLLAGGGRGLWLWDAASGQLLLDLRDHSDYVTGLAFAPDGKRLAVSSRTAFTPGKIIVWDLQNGRDIRTLRGLVGQVAKICYSPNGRYLAALSHRWQIGVWEVASGRLVRLLDAPQGGGLFFDNAALAFDEAGRRLAFSAGNEDQSNAVLWEVESGKELRNWKLPPGLVDHLAFQPSGKLLLFRAETKGMKLGPWSGVDRQEHPRVCRVRNLLGLEPTKPLYEIAAYNWHIWGGAATPDGKYFVIDGVKNENQKTEHRLAIIEAETGRETWSMRVFLRAQAATSARVDPTGKLLIFCNGDNYKRTLVEIPSGKLVSDAGLDGVLSLSSGARYCLRYRESGLSLIRREDGANLIDLGIDFRIASEGCFNLPGTQCAWGNTDGTVNIADIPEVQRRLAPVGLGW